MTRLDDGLPPRQVRDRPVDTLLIDQLDRAKPVDFRLKRGGLRFVGTGDRNLALDQIFQRIVIEQNIERSAPGPC